MADDHIHEVTSQEAEAVQLVGARLKAAREARGLSLAQVAAQTKITERMLGAIEASNWAALPGKTYATGFTRTYAKALGLDEVDLVGAVRRELGTADVAESRHVPVFEPGDPARVPGSKTVIVALLLLVAVVVAGLFLWRSGYAPGAILPSILPEESETTAAAAVEAEPIETPSDSLSEGAEPTFGATDVAPAIPSLPGIPGQQALAPVAGAAMGAPALHKPVRRLPRRPVAEPGASRDANAMPENLLPEPMATGGN